MIFTFTSILGMIISSVLLLPDLVLTIKNTSRNINVNKFLLILDYLLKYACFILMFLPIGIEKLGFSSVVGMFIYLGGNTILMVVYLILAFLVIKKQTIKLEKWLVYVSCLVFIISAFTLYYWLLLVLAICYAGVHTKILNGGDYE